MIVDDEPLIRRGLRETIEWDNLGLEVAGEACNGQEALNIIEKINPQIIITDVKMPIMDGISLIKKINELNIKVKVIILSGYNEYEYLKEAIKYNVESYLLKPIDQNELISILKSTIINIEQELDMRLQNRQGVQALKNNTLNRLITNNITLKEFKDKSRIFDITLNYNNDYYVIVGSIESYNKVEVEEIWEQDNYLKLFGAMNICDEIISKNGGIVFNDNDGQIVIIFDSSKENKLHEAIKEILQNIYKYLGLSIIIGVGSQMPLDNLYKSYYMAVDSLQYGFITRKENVIYASNIQQDVKIRVLKHIDFELIKTLILSKDNENLADYFQCYFKSLSEENIYIDNIRNSIIEIVIYISRIMDDFRLDKKMKLKTLKIEYSKLMKINRLDVMIQWLISYCDQVISGIGDETNKKGSKLIQDVIEYSHLNYYNNISLKSLSSMLDINTSYLGQLFKKEVGKSFAEYINQYRIKKAIEYLKDTNMKVYEICEEVGFTNYQYFVKIFKKYTGSTPSDYKS
jgi:two-component system response regulator YesN